MHSNAWKKYKKIIQIYCHTFNAECLFLQKEIKIISFKSQLSNLFFISSSLDEVKSRFFALSYFPI